MTYNATIQILEPNLKWLFYNLQVRKPGREMNNNQKKLSLFGRYQKQSQKEKIKIKENICNFVTESVSLIHKRMTNNPVEKSRSKLWTDNT